MSVLDESLDLPINRPVKTYRIGIVGAGGIVQQSHLPAYAAEGWTVSHIAAKRMDNAVSVAKQFGIPRATDDWREVIADPDVDVVDVSLPTLFNEEVCLAAFAAGKPVLVQKPVALDLATAQRLVEAAEYAKVPFAVNQNGRWDPAIRATKELIQRGHFGELVTATVELRTRQPWQQFWEDKAYTRLMLVGMSIHHLDQFRYLFGDPVEVTAITSTYPGQPWQGESMAFYCLRYESGLITCGLDDGFPWLPEWSATFRVEGTEAIARGKFGWPTGGPSSLSYVLADNPSVTHDARLTLKWFPDAFRGTMGTLFDYIATGIEPEISARNNLGTMRLVEACYLSAAEKRTVQMKEIN